MKSTQNQKATITKLKKQVLGEKKSHKSIQNQTAILTFNNTSLRKIF